nr:uncharacterized protein LOC109148273 [Ipomoea batatas]
MKIIYLHTLLLLGFLVLLVFCSVDADSQVNTTSNNVLDTASAESLKSNDTVNEELGRINSGNEKIVDLGKDNSSKQVESKGAEKDVGANVRSSGSKDDKKGDIKDSGDHASEKKGEQKVKAIGGSGSESGNEVTLSSGRKDGIRGEECDSSFSCNIEEESLVACLRVPGNESPDLSLLIQNKGKGHVSVSISAPKYVQLEKRQIELKEKENQKIKVSFRDSGSENFITLKAGNGKCNLHFRDLIEHSTDKEAEYVSQFNYFTLSSFGMIFLVALLLCASVWTFITYRKKHLAKTGGKYQRLDMELPVSNGAKIEADANDGWDNSWDDNWDDDEEAPKTPVMPITPSLSSKGIAPRRSNKEGWKD